MKKVVTILVIAVLFSTTVFAAPLSSVGSKDSLFQEVSPIELSSVSLNNADDLFVGVQAVSLTDKEAEAVEGEGLFGFIFGAITAAATAAIVIVDLVQGNTNNAANHLAGGMTVAGGLVLLVP